MKVLLITNDFPPMIGGLATWYERVCATVPPDRVLVLAPRMPGDVNFDVKQPYRVFRARIPISPNPLARLIQVAILFACAIRIIRHERVGVVHIGHLHLGPIGLGIRFFVGIPYVMSLHGGEMAPYLSIPAIRAVVRAVVRHAQLVVVNSSYTLRHFEAMGIRNLRVQLLTLSVATERFRPDADTQQIRAKYGLDGYRIILTVGRLVERKGHDVVIQALNSVKRSAGPIRYLIAGLGPEEQRLRRLARDLGCSEEVIFAGYVPEDDLPSLYAACDVFVMASRALPQRDGVEGFGIVFLEAGACGKPVIGGRSGGIAEAVLDGISGILVDPTNVDELAQVVTHLLLRPDEARRLGAQGRQRAQALQATWATAVARVFDSGEAGGVQP